MAISSWSLGIIFIVIVAVIWAGSSVLTQYIFADLHFNSPFVVTYIESSIFIIYLPLFYISVVLGHERVLPTRRGRQHFSNNGKNVQYNDSSSEGGQLLIDGGNEDYNKETAVTISGGKFASHEDIFRIALLICPIWFISNCFYNYSLLMTSVSSSTIISNLSGPFTLLFSWLAGVESISYRKVLGLVVCFIGVCAVGLADESAAQNRTFEGDIVALFASAGYGVYTTVLKCQVPDEDEESASMSLLFGYIGLINFIFLLPILISLIWLGIADISNLTLQVFLFLLVEGFLDNAVADFLWARAIVLTSPTVATVGLSFTIPLAMITDALLGKKKATYVEVVGAIGVIAGFLIVNFEQRTETTDHVLNPDKKTSK